MTESQKIALAELLSKSIVDIQVETARTWAYRAWAAKQLAAQAKARDDKQAFVSYLIDSAEYAHEAVEHAALSEDSEILIEVRRIIRGA
jgi:hypothetical protein